MVQQGGSASAETDNSSLSSAPLETNEVEFRNSSSTSEPAFKSLWVALSTQEWEKVLILIPQVRPEILVSSVGPKFIPPGVSILHYAVEHYAVPFAVVETMLRCSKGPDSTDQPGLAAMKNEAGETPLHIAVQFNLRRPSIIKLLLRDYPEALNQRDEVFMRPIDHLAHKVIMLQERRKYDEDEDKKMLSMWEVLEAFVFTELSFSEGFVISNLPRYLLHACLQVDSVPLSLLTFVMKEKEHEFLLTDYSGDLPLHIIARKVPRRSKSKSCKNTDSEDEDDDEDEDDVDDQIDHLNRAIKAFPDATRMKNHQQKTPLVVAIESGRTWNSGILDLLNVYPAGIVDVDLTVEVYPMLLHRLGTHYTTAFEILRAQPDVFQHIQRHYQVREEEIDT